MIGDRFRAKRGACPLLLLLALALPAAGDGGTGGRRSGAILDVPVGARIPALGGAGVASVGGPEGASLNPAAWAALDEGTLHLYYERFVEDIDFSHLAYGQPISRDGTLGISLTYGDYGSFDRLGINPVTLQPVSLGRFSADDLVLTIGYGHRAPWGVASDLRVGIAGKLIQSQIDDARAMTGAFDLGLEWDAPIDGLVVGGSIRNVGRGLSFDRDRDDLPLALRTGVSYQFLRDRLRLALDVEHSAASDGSDVGLGVEFHPVDLLALRMGYNSSQEAEDGLSFGMGVKWNQIALDYAYVPYGIFDDVHRISATVGLGVARRAGTGEVSTSAEPVSVVAPRPEPSPPSWEPKPEPAPPAEPAPIAGDRAAARRALATGQDAYDRDDLATAEASFERAWQLDPTFADAAYNLATARYLGGRYEAACAAFREVVRLRPDDAEAWRYLGFACYGAQDPGRALAAWRRAASLDPNDRVSIENARALEEAGISPQE